MSYNIDTWKTKKLENLKIPMSAFYQHEREDWHPSFLFIGNGKFELTGYDSTLEGEIIGETRADEIFCVSKIDIHGEASGTFKSWILNPALEQSTGILEAVLIWEGGDSISNLKVKDGVITEEDIEL